MKSINNESSNKKIQNDGATLIKDIYHSLILLHDKYSTVTFSLSTQEENESLIEVILVQKEITDKAEDEQKREFSNDFNLCVDMQCTLNPLREKYESSAFSISATAPDAFGLVYNIGSKKTAQEYRVRHKNDVADDSDLPF